MTDLALPWDVTDPVDQTDFPQRIQDNFDTLASTVGPVTTYAAWQPVTLINGWAAQYGTSVGYYAAYGRVWFRGRLAGGTSGSIAFQMPPGVRPGQADTYSCPSFNSITAVAGAALIGTDGNVTLYVTTGAVDIGLGGVSYRAEK